MQYLIIGIIFILALFAIHFSNKRGIPALLLFIVLGMAFGAIGIKFEDFEFSYNFSTIALMVIMFYGGFIWCCGYRFNHRFVFALYFGV